MRSTTIEKPQRRRAAGIGVIALRLLGSVGAALERARQRRALGTLSDAGLKDIGLSRAEVEAECRKWPWRP